MTNRQSNLIFYSVISLIIGSIIINYVNPDFFTDASKSKEEILVTEAMSNGEHNKALTIYHTLVDKQFDNANETTAETAAMYEEMGNLYRLLGNKNEEKNYYLKSLSVKEQLEKNNISSFARTYDKLGSLAEKEKQYDQAQMYYEKSLSIKLGNASQTKNDGLVLGYQHDREQYLRLNNDKTIATLKKLGEIHTLKKEYDTAKKYYDRALAASKLTFGDDDSRTLEVAKLIDQLAL